MLLNSKQKQHDSEYVKSFDTKKYRVSKINQTEETNELIFMESKF